MSMIKPSEESSAAPHAALYPLLLRLAREAIAQFLATGELPTVERQEDWLEEWLQEPAAVFVTLWVREGRDGTAEGGEAWTAGELRGCVGQIEATAPLFIAVQEAAVKAATADPRFYPVSPGELDNLSIEISVLSPLRRVRSLEAIVIGRDGLLIVGDRRRGLLLPEVAVDYGWGREAFVRALCHKAGLPADAWPGKARLYAFTTESFSE